MSQITYSEKHVVRLDGKTVGEIRAVYSTTEHGLPSAAFGYPGGRPGNIVGYRYHPKGGEAGETFNSLAGCKQSLVS